jgi:hypothetical protein
MNSLRVDGFFRVVFLRNGHGRDDRMREARCCRHLGSHALPGGWWAPRCEMFQSPI